RRPSRRRDVPEDSPFRRRQRRCAGAQLTLRAAALVTDELIAAYEATLPFMLDEFQREAIAKLEQSRGVLVSAPTSSGKTVVAEYAIWRRLSAPRALRRPQGAPQALSHTTPLKALSNQKFRDLGERYGTARIGPVTRQH